MKFVLALVAMFNIAAAEYLRHHEYSDDHHEQEREYRHHSPLYDHQAEEHYDRTYHM